MPSPWLVAPREFRPARKGPWRRQAKPRAGGAKGPQALNGIFRFSSIFKWCNPPFLYSSPSQFNTYGQRTNPSLHNSHIHLSSWFLNDLWRNDEDDDGCLKIKTSCWFLQRVCFFLVPFLLSICFIKVGSWSLLWLIAFYSSYSPSSWPNAHLMERVSLANEFPL